MKNSWRYVGSAVLSVVLALAVMASGARDMWADSLLFVALLGLVMLLLWSSWGGEPLRLPLLPWLSLLIIVFFVSYRCAVAPEESYLGFGDAAVLAVAVWLGSNLFTSDRERSWLRVLLAVTIVIEAIVGVMQKLALRQGFVFADFGGPFINANFAAPFNLLWTPFFFDRWREDLRSGHPWSIHLIPLVALAVSFYINASVTAGVILAAALFYRMVVNAKETADHRGVFMGLFMASVFVAVAAIGFKLFHPHSFVQMNIPSTPWERIQWWRSGWRMALAYPLWGVGPGGFANAYLAFKVGNVQNTLFAHSGGVTILAETGWIGLLAFGLAIGFWWKNHGATAWLERERRPFVAGILLFGLFVSVNIGLELSVNLLALGLCLGIAAQSGSSLAFRPRRSVIVVATALIFSLIPIIADKFFASQNIVAGQQELAEGRIDQAQTEFSEAIALDSSSAEAYRGLAKTFAASGAWWKAITAQRTAIDKNKLSAVLWWELGNYLERAGDRPGAQMAYDQASRYHAGNRRFAADAHRLTEPD